jgi:dihydrofolate reductase
MKEPTTRKHGLMSNQLGYLPLAFCLSSADVRFEGDVRSVHQEMMAVAGDQNIWLVGGGDLVGQFHDRGLLDEVIVSIASVTLGSGAPLLPRRITTPGLKLLSTRVYGDAFVELHYKVPRPRR